MELEDVLPSKPEFTLSKNNKTYQLRVIDLDDHVWIKDKYGSAEVVEAHIKNENWTQVILLIYRLLVDKSDFMASESTIIDDDGVEKKAFLTGPFKLLKAFSGPDEAIKAVAALAKSITLSNPLIDKYVKEQINEEIKKKRIGVKSLTRSQASTVGRQKK